MANSDDYNDLLQKYIDLESDNRSLQQELDYINENFEEYKQFVKETLQGVIEETKET